MLISYNPRGRDTPIYNLQCIWVCATVKGMVFKQFGLGQGIEIREFWSKIGYQLLGNW